MKTFRLVLAVLAILAFPAFARAGGLNVAAEADPVVPLAPAPTSAACGSSPHCVVLTWTAPADVVSGSTYNVYTLAGTAQQACPTTAPSSTPGGFTKVNTAAISTTTYTVPESSPGGYCFFVTQVQNTAESNPSNDVPAVILPLSPTVETPQAF